MQHLQLAWTRVGRRIMIEIALKDIEKYYGANHILKGVTFEVNQGERLGLLGRNGAGKTTLFKVIAGTENCDAGSRMVRKGAAIGILDQIPDFPPDYTSYDVLYTAFDQLLEVHREMVSLEKVMAEGKSIDDTLKKYGRLQQLFEAREGYVIEENIAKVCNGLKIGSGMLNREFGLLSGGEKTRVVLGRLILQKPDIILLDEPTNHLDLGSVEWLEEFLAEYKGTAIIISHDRYFLDRAITKILELVDGRVETYEGNYSYYIREKEERYQLQLEKYQQEQKKIKRLEAAAKRLHEWAVMADNGAMHKRAFSIEKRIERMEKTEKPGSEQGIETSFVEYGFSGRDAVIARSVVKSFDGIKVLDNVDFLVQKAERVAILGDNGSGKSTLIKAITEEVEVDSGCVKTGDSMKYAYLPQLVTFEEPELSILDTVRNSLRISEGAARNLLAKYKFRNEDVHKTVKKLSGGEKSRLRLCILMQNDVNLLLLDEPTNHLDIESREWLENALADFGGTIIFVSHDRYFINKFASRVSELKSGKITDFYGDYEYYRAKVLEQQREKETVPVKAGKRENTRACRQKVADPGEDKTEKIQKLEKAISELETIMSGIDQEMQLYADDYGKLNSLYTRKSVVEGELEELYGQWAMLNE